MTVSPFGIPQQAESSELTSTTTFLGYKDEAGIVWLTDGPGRQPLWRHRLPRDRDPAQDFISRFWASMEVVGECWEWQGKRRNGYGLLEGGLGLAYRMAYTLSVGWIPPGMVVRHTCDNRPCCRPAHLILGTRRDNVLDSWARGTARSGGAGRGGERSSQSKVTQVQVDEMRQRSAAGEKLAPLAADYGISISQVSNIVRGKSWA